MRGKTPVHCLLAVAVAMTIGACGPEGGTAAPHDGIRPVPSGLAAPTVAGGGDISLTQVTSRGEHWLLIQRCND
jgi:hypothetical protein